MIILTLALSNIFLVTKCYSMMSFVSFWYISLLFLTAFCGAALHPDYTTQCKMEIVERILRDDANYWAIQSLTHEYVSPGVQLYSAKSNQSPMLLVLDPNCMGYVVPMTGYILIQRANGNATIIKPDKHILNVDMEQSLVWMMMAADPSKVFPCIAEVHFVISRHRDGLTATVPNIDSIALCEDVSIIKLRTVREYVTLNPALIPA